jgi:dihydrodipicolinate synthase/N-acetylneuraminate lyase
MSIKAEKRSEKLLQGIVVPTVTPLTEKGNLDVEALERLVEYLIAGRVTGLFVAGTTGEGPALSQSIRREMVQRVCAQVKGRIPVVVAAMDPSLREALATSSHAAEVGADAMAFSPPYYLALSESDTLRFGQIVATESALPGYLYNVPYTQLPQFSPDVLRRLADFPKILGLKDSSGDFAQLVEATRIFSHRPECSVLVGPERLLAAALREGADGGVSGGGNLLPTLYMDLYESHIRGDHQQVDALQKKVLGVERDFYKVGEPESSLVRGVKAALYIKGICGFTMVEPFVGADDDEIEEVRHRLAGYEAFSEVDVPGIL